MNRKILLMADIASVCGRGLTLRAGRLMIRAFQRAAGGLVYEIVSFGV